MTADRPSSEKRGLLSRSRLADPRALRSNLLFLEDQAWLGHVAHGHRNKFPAAHPKLVELRLHGHGVRQHFDDTIFKALLFLCLRNPRIPDDENSYRYEDA